VRVWRSKRAVVVVVVVLLALFLVRPGANRLRTRIVSSISLALGRPGDVAAVRLRLLPHPGFDLQNFVVHEDPAFGAEPLLRASDVTASLRITSLLRGRIEIARLNLTEPSLNLVRNSTGHWNLENLIERAAKVPVAPTSKGKTERRPGFPYIEAEHGRINFKFADTKSVFYLTETDLDISPPRSRNGGWSVYCSAKPARTDRAAQGLGAAIISPAALSIVTTLFRDGAERNKALGILGAIAGSGAAIGVLPLQSTRKHGRTRISLYASGDTR